MKRLFGGKWLWLSCCLCAHIKWYFFSSITTKLKTDSCTVFVKSWNWWKELLLCMQNEVVFEWQKLNYFFFPCWVPTNNLSWPQQGHFSVHLLVSFKAASEQTWGGINISDEALSDVVVKVRLLSFFFKVIFWQWLKQKKKSSKFPWVYL